MSQKIRIELTERTYNMLLDIFGREFKNLKDKKAALELYDQLGNEVRV